MNDIRRKGVAEFDTVDASSAAVGVVVSRFNANITDNLLSGACAELERHAVAVANVDIHTVSGAYEIPLVLQTMAISERYQLLLAIGCVIRGETPHFDYVCQECARGTTRVMLDHSLPIGFGVLTCDSMAQAEARSGRSGEPGGSNKGAEAAQAAIESWSVLNTIRAGST